jgi:hypothetical protein
MKARVQRGSYLNADIAEADDLTYIVVFSDDDDPLAVIEQVGRDHVQITHAGEKTFPGILGRLGVKPARIAI